MTVNQGVYYLVAQSLRQTLVDKCVWENAHGQTLSTKVTGAVTTDATGMTSCVEDDEALTNTRKTKQKQIYESETTHYKR